MERSMDYVVINTRTETRLGDYSDLVEALAAVAWHGGRAAGVRVFELLADGSRGAVVS